jgi:hypothetical protein
MGCKKPVKEVKEEEWLLLRVKISFYGFINC